MAFLPAVAALIRDADRSAHDIYTTSVYMSAPIEGAGAMASAARAKIFPHLWYARDAEGAARFYASVFPDSRVDRVTALLSDSPSGPPESVKIVDFTLFGQRFQAMSAGPHHEFNDAVSMVVLCDDQAELERYWDALLEGGGKPQACGWLIDRFGLRWQIVPAVLDQMMRDGDPARSKRVTDALLKMVKLDIAALEKAYRV
jgi:predicted 3-demethylubiquinone-9 3-methyltransferase (glyoxalase superfamily)